MKTKIGSGIILDDIGRILLIKRKHHKEHLPNYRSIPGGRQDPGEELEQTAIREVKEEIGVDFEIVRFFFEEETEHNIFYRYIGTVTGTICIQEEECDGYARFFYQEAKKLLIRSTMENILDKLYEEKLLS